MELNQHNEKYKLNKVFLILGCICSFVLVFYISLHLDNRLTPDELSRFKVPEFIQKNNKLPTGFEEEVRIPLWGFSYAFRPYFAQLLSAFFMKICSSFDDSLYCMYVAGRFVSVLAYVGTFVLAYLIGCELFKRKGIPELFAVSIAALPQSVFLGAYINNDALSLTECMGMAYIWILIYKYGLKNKYCISLGVVIGFAFLTYYNNASFVICSILVCLYCAIFREKLSAIEILKKAGLTVISAFVIAGGWMIRNAILYDGDFLGMKTENLYGELYAVDTLKPDNMFNGFHMCGSFVNFVKYTILGGTAGWFGLTYKSFIGVFGYMSVFLPAWIYVLSFVLFVTGVIAFIIYWKSESNIAKQSRIFIALVLFVSFALPPTFSYMQSYLRDYQAQGRYMIASLIPLTVCWVCGASFIADLLAKKIKKRNIEFIFICVLAIGIICVSLYALKTGLSSSLLYGDIKFTHG